VSLHLFVGGTWGGRIVDVAPVPYIEVPVVRAHPMIADHLDGMLGGRDLTTHLYEQRRWVALIPHPCVRSVKVAHEWKVYTYGNRLGPAGLAHLPQLPPDHTEWLQEVP